MVQTAPIRLNSSGSGEMVQVEMTVEEYLNILKGSKEVKRNVGKGLNGIMEIFNCSKSTAYIISHKEWFQPAIIVKQGKFFSFDKDMAYALAKEFTTKE